MKKSTSYLTILILLALSLWLIKAISETKIHNFEGKCLLCHKIMPQKDGGKAMLYLRDNITNACEICHNISKEKSHPVNVRPNGITPLSGHLDSNGYINCATCHDVHKENKTINKPELSGLLWGHAKGRAFCSLCHNETTQSPDKWKHQGVTPYAHSNGKLTQNDSGAMLDEFSTECLSCHDGTNSGAVQARIKQGIWKHGGEIGMSHPVGINYPHSEDFTPLKSLPKEIQLFDGKIGCLSCHEIYMKEKDMLSINNKKSRLCLSCHKK